MHKKTRNTHAQKNKNTHAHKNQKHTCTQNQETHRHKKNKKPTCTQHQETHMHKNQETHMHKNTRNTHAHKTKKHTCTRKQESNKPRNTLHIHTYITLGCAQNHTLEWTHCDSRTGWFYSYTACAEPTLVVEPAGSAPTLLVLNPMWQ